MKIIHKFISEKAPSPDPTKIGSVQWDDFHSDENGLYIDVVPTSPPDPPEGEGTFQAENLYVDEVNNQVVVEYENQQINLLAYPIDLGTF